MNKTAAKLPSTPLPTTGDGIAQPHALGAVDVAANAAIDPASLPACQAVAEHLLATRGQSR